MKEEASVAQKIDVTSEDKQSTEDEKDKDTKEDTNIVGDNRTAPEQKQLEEKPDGTDVDEGEEKPDTVAIEMADGVEHVAVAVEEEAKTENVEGGEGGEGEVKTEVTEGGEGEIKPESTEGGEREPSLEGTLPLTSETVLKNETETGTDYSKYEIDDELPWAMYRSMDSPPQRTPVEEDEDWPASDDDEDYGKLFESILFLLDDFRGIRLTGCKKAKSSGIVLLSLFCVFFYLSSSQE